MPPTTLTEASLSAVTDEQRDQSLSHKSHIRSVWDSLSHHAKKHVGVGIVCAVAYFDPGNWSTDLQAGSQFGYKLLFVVLLSGLGAVLVQILACKLGCVTGLDLAAHCRLLLHDHPRFPRLVRWIFLYPLYALSELAIISTDLAELLGSAIGLVLLFPKLPLPVAVLLTATDVIFILAIRDPSKGHGRPVRVFEFIIIILVLVVFISMVVLIVKVDPQWPSVFKGFLPSKTLVQPDALYAAIGIVGATVMPHALYLGSYLATQDRVSMEPSILPSDRHDDRRASVVKAIKSLFTVRRSTNTGLGSDVDVNTPHGERDNNTLSFVKAHLSHALVDLIGSLLGFAVVINSAILILAGAVFFFGPQNVMDGSAASLFDAYDIIRDLVGKPAAIFFALALVCSGQSASITATLAGQIVSEGFIQWNVSPVLRRLITRLLGLIPSMTVAIVVGRNGISSMLVISQVILSIVLPFVMFPLIWLTSSKLVMRVKRPRQIVSISVDNALAMNPDEKQEGSSSSVKTIPHSNQDSIESTIEESGIVSLKGKEKEKILDTERLESTSPISEEGPEWVDDQEDYIDYSNGWILTVTSYATWLLILIANGYLIVTLALN